MTAAKRSSILRWMIGLTTLAAIFLIRRDFLVSQQVQIREIAKIEFNNATTNSFPNNDNITVDTKPGRIYTCGYTNENLRKMIFPDLEYHGRYRKTVDSNSKDIIFFGMHGSCEANLTYIESHFQGNVLVLNGEPIGSIVGKPHHNLYQIGGPMVGRGSGHLIRGEHEKIVVSFVEMRYIPSKTTQLIFKLVVILHYCRQLVK